MGPIKMLSLASMVAALMAFVGASTASATVLCKVEGTGTPAGTTCPAGSAYEKGTEIHATLDPGTGPAKLITGFGSIECGVSTFRGKTSNEGSATETVKGNIETLTFEECNCEVKVLKNGSLEIHWIEGTHNGTFTWSGAEVTMSCEEPFIGKIHCIYQTDNTDLGTLTGGKPATIDSEEVEIPRLLTSSFCTERAEWNAKYEVTSPSPLYVAGHT